MLSKNAKGRPCPFFNAIALGPIIRKSYQSYEIVLFTLLKIFHLDFYSSTIIFNSLIHNSKWDF